MTHLITGAMGCLGAWTLHHLVKTGKRAISFDLSDNRHRLNLLLSPREQENITFIQGDLTDFEQVKNVMQAEKVTNIIHLAALQVPFCKANPVMGARVNVVGSVNIFEAAKELDIKHVAYASSLAVYGSPELYPADVVADDAVFAPGTLYGVYKQANEGTAQIYWQDHGISSITMRPYTVYGVARDQGLTSEPTKAMLAAAAGKPYHISFGGKMQFHFASDMAAAFINASEMPIEGAQGFNPGGEVVAVSDFAKLIMDIKPDVEITVGDTVLPFPEGLEGRNYDQLGVPHTALQEGIRQSIVYFETCLNDGRLSLD